MEMLVAVNCSTPFHNIHIRQYFIQSDFDQFLFSFVRIGYGNIAPATELGKIATIFYAIIGMPLFLLYLSNIGNLLRALA